MLETFQIEFGDSEKPSVSLPKDSALSMALNATNSNLLFGCRIGICGTCVMEVEFLDDARAPRTGELEAERRGSDRVGFEVPLHGARGEDERDHRTGDDRGGRMRLRGHCRA